MVAPAHMRASKQHLCAQTLLCAPMRRRHNSLRQASHKLKILPHYAFPLPWISFASKRISFAARDLVLPCIFSSFELAFVSKVEVGVAQQLQ